MHFMICKICRSVALSRKPGSKNFIFSKPFPCCVRAVRFGTGILLLGTMERAKPSSDAQATQRYIGRRLKLLSNSPC